MYQGFGKNSVAADDVGDCNIGTARNGVQSCMPTTGGKIIEGRATDETFAVSLDGGPGGHDSMEQCRYKPTMNQ
jgi:hypothetical protein